MPAAAMRSAARERTRPEKNSLVHPLPYEEQADPLVDQSERILLEHAGKPEIQRPGVNVADARAQPERRLDLFAKAGGRARVLGLGVPQHTRIFQIAVAQLHVRLARHLAERHVIADARELLADDAVAVHDATRDRARLPAPIRGGQRIEITRDAVVAIDSCFA